MSKVLHNIHKGNSLRSLYIAYSTIVTVQFRFQHHYGVLEFGHIFYRNYINVNNNINRSDFPVTSLKPAVSYTVLPLVVNCKVM